VPLHVSSLTMTVSHRKHYINCYAVVTVNNMIKTAGVYVDACLGLGTHTQKRVDQTAVTPDFML